MLIVQPKDSRGYFMLPQAPEDAGYYVYGTLDNHPSHGASQYAHPALMTLILRVEREWRHLDTRKFGVGDISLANGTDHPDHESHMTGLDVDVRPVRKDGQRIPVTWQQRDYDRDATAKLIELFMAFAPVKHLFFNDPSIPFARQLPKHDNHFHIALRE
jgi:penicillin-insensitive murein DD-endopeptidase